LGRPW
jgi:hypothetical protein